MQVLIDTSFLLATVVTSDRNHERARQAMRDYTGQRFIAAPVLTELFYMTMTRSNYLAAVNLLNRIHTANFEIISVSAEDRTV